MKLIQESKNIIKFITRRFFSFDPGLKKVIPPPDFVDQKKILQEHNINSEIIFDVGSNVGQTTQKYRKLFPQSEIFGFEPFPDVYKIYSKTVFGDNLVKKNMIALSNKIGNAVFFTYNKCHYTNSLLPLSESYKKENDFKNESVIKIRTDTLDNYCNINHINHISILKIDVQGAEMLVLEGAREMLSKKAIDIIYTEIEFVPLYKNQSLSEDIEKYLMDFGYVLHKKYNISHDNNGRPVSGDAIFVRQNLNSQKYHSQYSQDKFIDQKIFKKKTGGVFLEMGADDGIVGSNTLFFEKERGWSGLCIEPRRSAYEKLIKNRQCQTSNVAISSNEATTKKFIEAPGDMGQISGLVETFDKRYLDRLQKEATERGITTATIDVQTVTVNGLLEKFKLFHIDYFSLDTEGGELQILQSIDFDRFNIECISVENPFEDKEFVTFLSKKGYKKITRIKIDDIFILRNSPFNMYTEPLTKKIEVILKSFKRDIKKLIRFENYQKHDRKN